MFSMTSPIKVEDYEQTYLCKNELKKLQMINIVIHKHLLILSSITNLIREISESFGHRIRNSWNFSQVKITVLTVVTELTVGS